MRAIIVELPAMTDITAELSQIRTWCGDHQCEPTSFRYHLNGNAKFIVVAEFIKNTCAELFKKRFSGLESEFVNLKQKHSIETMATVCWWRLKAEDIRAEYDNFACSSARDTMAGVARCYDTMAEHLEHRLAREGGCLSSESSCYTRFAFR